MSASQISIIDDDQSMLLALANLLRFLGFETRAYGSAEEFIEFGSGETVSCIITDVHMPGLGGIGLKRWLDDRANTVPVIMITGRSEPHLHAQALASGATCLLKKPFDADTLLDSLKKADIV